VDNNSDRCFDQERIKRVRTKFLLDEFRKAFNVTDQLGMEVINECAFFRANEAGMVELLTGTDVCDFVTYERNYRAWDQCTDEAVAQRQFRLALLGLAPNKRDYFVNVQCAFRNSFRKDCFQQLAPCFSEEKRKKNAAEEMREFKALELKVGAVLGEENFNFAEECGAIDEERDVDEKEDFGEESVDLRSGLSFKSIS